MSTTAPASRPTSPAVARARKAAEKAGNWPALIPGTNEWSVESSTTPGTFYRVYVGAESSICSCEARGYCRHIAATELCMERGIRAAYCECPMCRTRVNRTGQLCQGCASLQKIAAGPRMAEMPTEYYLPPSALRARVGLR